MSKKTGNIYDPTTGEHIAWIVGQDVFSVATNQKFATLRGTDLYSLDGQILGVHLEEAFTVHGRSDTAAVAQFSKLAKKSKS
jgi:hypothetical protein